MSSTLESAFASMITNELYWIFSDHLQSSSVILEEDGDTDSRTTYTAFGEERKTVGPSSTDYEPMPCIGCAEFERCSNSSGDSISVENSRIEFSPLNSVSCSFDFGLMFYNARWYDPDPKQSFGFKRIRKPNSPGRRDSVPSCAHFTSADTIIPQPGNSGDWNRYAYVLYNPANFNDPSGHYSGKYNTALEWVDDLGIDLGAQYMRDNLPDYIPTDDETLFRAYIALYMSTDVFIINPFTDEYSSGYQMALYIAQNGITLEWSQESPVGSFTTATTLEHCSFTSYACTTRGDSVIYFVRSEHFDEGNNPLRTPEEIAGTIAHEVYHQITDFSGSSVFEEYMAVWASLNVNGTDVYNLSTPFSMDQQDLSDVNYLIMVLDSRDKYEYGRKYGKGVLDAHPSNWQDWIK